MPPPQGRRPLLGRPATPSRHSPRGVGAEEPPAPRCCSARAAGAGAAAAALAAAAFLYQMQPIGDFAHRLAPSPPQNPGLRRVMAEVGLGAYAHMLEREGLGIADFTVANAASGRAGLKPFHWELLLEAVAPRRAAAAAPPPAERAGAEAQPPPPEKAPPADTGASPPKLSAADADLPTPVPPINPCTNGFKVEPAAWYEGERLPPHPTTDTPEECGRQCAELWRCQYFNWRSKDKACHRLATRSTRHIAPDHSAGRCALAADGLTENASAATATAAAAAAPAAPAARSAGVSQPAPASPAAPAPAGGPAAAAPAPAGTSVQWAGEPADPRPPPPRGAPAPPACTSWARTAGTRAWWLAVRAARQKEAPAPRAVPGAQEPAPLCADTQQPAVQPAAGAETAATSRHAAQSAAARAGWAHGSLTRGAIARLRVAGVIDQLYVDHELRLLYCAVPKAACTSTKAWLLKAAGYGEVNNPHNRSLYNGPRLQSGSVIPDAALLRILNDGEYFKFTMVRNPYTRALASFLERFHNCRMRRSEGECLMWARALVGTRYSREQVLGMQMTFADYLSAMAAVRRTGEQRLNWMTAHWLPAAHVCAVDELPFDFIGRMENPDDISLVHELAGVPWHGSATARRLAHSEGTSRKLAKYYTSSTLKATTLLYRQDTSQLGYLPDGVVPGVGQPPPPPPEAAAASVPERAARGAAGGAEAAPAL